MASSVDSLCIRFVLLLRIGLKASARGTDPHKQPLRRVRSITISSPTYLLYPTRIYVKDIGFSGTGHLPLRGSLFKGSLSFRLRFRLKLSSDSSLDGTTMQSPHGELAIFIWLQISLVPLSSDTLAVLPINSLLSGL